MALDHWKVAQEIEESTETDAQGHKYHQFRLVMDVNGITFYSEMLTRKEVVKALRRDYAIENLKMVQAKTKFESWESNYEVHQK